MSHADVYCVFTNRAPATAMRGFGVTAVDFAIECQMDKLAQLVGMDPMEFRILNAYRDGDMKAHRREAKNTALIECVQVAAEKANGAIRDDFKRMSSRKGGGGAAAPTVPARRPQRRRCMASRPAGQQPQQSTTGPRRRHPRTDRGRRLRHPPSPPPAAAAHRTARSRFSSVFGTQETMRWPSFADAAWRLSTIRSA